MGGVVYFKGDVCARARVVGAGGRRVALFDKMTVRRSSAGGIESTILLHNVENRLRVSNCAIGSILKFRLSQVYLTFHKRNTLFNLPESVVKK